jgi:hypothetical protein
VVEPDLSVCFCVCFQHKRTYFLRSYFPAVKTFLCDEIVAFNVGMFYALGAMIEACVVVKRVKVEGVS